MSNYAELYEQVMGYLQQSLTLTDPFPGTAGDATAKRVLIDKLCLRAANNVRKRAELLNDWVYNQVSAEVTVPAGESILMENLTDIDSGAVFTGFKNVKEVTYEGVPINLNGVLHGLRRKFMKPCFNRCRGEFHGKHFKIHPALTEDVDLVVYGTKWMDKYSLAAQEVTGFDVQFVGIVDPFHCVLLPDLIQGRPAYAVGNFVLNYADFPIPADADPLTMVYWDTEYWNAVHVPDGINQAPNTTTYGLIESAATEPPTSGYTPNAVTLTAFVDVIENDGSTVTDWLLQDGFEYMQWATICELNHLLEVYLPRQEGKLPPPDRQREESLEALMRWDTEMRDAQFNMKSR